MKLRELQPRRIFKPSTIEAAADQEDEVASEYSPEQLVKATDWQAIVDGVKKEHQRKAWANFLMQAADAVMLFPDRRNELPLDDQTFAELVRFVHQQTKYDDDYDDFLAYAWRLCVLYPDRRDEMDLDKHYDNAMRHLKEQNESWDLPYPVGSYYLAFAFLDQYAALGGKEEEMELQLVNLERERRIGIENLTSSAADFITLFPGQKHLVQISPAELRIAKEEMDANRNINIFSYAHSALNLAIITATRVERTRHGIIMHHAEQFNHEEGLPARSLVA